MYAAIAVISDIHSNKLALEAVLRDIEERNVELIVNLGDSLFGPVDPSGTARLLMQRPDMVNIMGNCDEILLREYSDSLTYSYVKPLLTPIEEDWIRAHHYTWRYDNLLFCHGTPWNNSQYLLELIPQHGGVVLKSTETLAEELRSIEEQIVFCGHSHVFRSLLLPGGKQVVNPGSVGLPAYEDTVPYLHRMETGTPYASYCICRRNAKVGCWDIEHILVRYDWDQAADLAEEHGRLDYADPIRTGRVSLRA